VSLTPNPLFGDSSQTGSSTTDGTTSPAKKSEGLPCPLCGFDIGMIENYSGWQSCPHCDKRVFAYAWRVARQNNHASTAVTDQATCFFHPEKVFQACCQRCGRFMCALCDLQLGAEHVCPTCFERGREDSGAAKAEWRYRDVLYDSIAATVGWGWILFWPTIIVAIPAVIFLHVKYRKAPRSYLIPRSNWRFWVAYVGLTWAPVLIVSTILAPLIRGKH
jgi:hypothetical protein